MTKRDHTFRCAKNMMDCPVKRQQHAASMRGDRNPFFGKTITPEMKAKFRASIGTSRYGEGNSMFGKHHSEGTRTQISHKRVQTGIAAGARNPNWKGGRSAQRTQRYTDMQTSRYKRWRAAVFKRDNYTCQNSNCGKRGGALEAHHVKSYTDFPELRYTVSNGQTLCRACHITTFKKHGQKRR